MIAGGAKTILLKTGKGTIPTRKIRRAISIIREFEGRIPEKNRTQVLKLKGYKDVVVIRAGTKFDEYGTATLLLSIVRDSVADGYENKDLDACVTDKRNRKYLVKLFRKPYYNVSTDIENMGLECYGYAEIAEKIGMMRKLLS